MVFYIEYNLELTNLPIIVVKEVEGGGVEELEDLLVPRRVLHQVHQGGVRRHTPDQVWQGYFVNTAIGILLAQQNISCKVNGSHNETYLACPAGRFPVWTSSLTELRRKMPMERKSREERDLS